jgi:hypothetical protein
MKESFKILLKDKMVRLLFIFSFVFLLIHIFFVALFYPNLPPYIPFFNSMPWGDARLIPSYLILSLPLVLCVIFMVNLGFELILYKRFPLIARVLQFNTTLFIFLSFLAFLQIVFLVF